MLLIIYSVHIFQISHQKNLSLLPYKSKYQKVLLINNFQQERIFSLDTLAYFYREMPLMPSLKEIFPRTNVYQIICNCGWGISSLFKLMWTAATSGGEKCLFLVVVFVFKRLLFFFLLCLLHKTISGEKSTRIKSSLIIRKCRLCEDGTLVSIRIWWKHPSITDCNNQLIHRVRGNIELFITPYFLGKFYSSFSINC